MQTRDEVEGLHNLILGKRFLLLNYKITKIVRALGLAERRVCIRICKHGCDFMMFCSNHASTNLKKVLS